MALIQEDHKAMQALILHSKPECHAYTMTSTEFTIHHIRNNQIALFSQTTV